MNIDRSLIDECLYLELTKKGNNHGSRLESRLVLASDGALHIQRRKEHRGDITETAANQEIEVKFCIHTKKSTFTWKHLRPCRKNIDELLIDLEITHEERSLTCKLQWFYLKWKTIDDYIEHGYRANIPKNPEWKEDELEHYRWTLRQDLTFGGNKRNIEHFIKNSVDNDVNKLLNRLCKSNDSS
jgi:hypothetical protein